MSKVKLLILFFVFTSSGLVIPQSNLDSEVNKIFNEAVEMYSAGNFRKALRLFEKITYSYSYNSKTTASIIFKGKTLVAMKNFSDAEILLKDFLMKYPESKYIDEAKLTLAKVYLEEKEYMRSVSELLSLYSGTKSGVIAGEVKAIAENLALQYLTIAEVRSLYDSSRDNSIKPFLLLLSGKLYIDNGLLSDASDTFSRLVNLYPESEERAEAEILKSGIKPGSKVKTEELTLIGVMLPLSGVESSEALTASKEILEGIKFAVSEFNEGRQDKIGIVIMDTEDSSEKIRKIKEQIELNSSIKLIIGPVFSSEVSVALEEFRDSDIPIISPTATDNDLTLINKNFFQANPNFVIRAKVMAQYIYFVENKRRIAVLNSIDGYSPLLAAEFINEFDKLGGEIIIKSTYKSGSLSSENQIREFSLGLSDAEGIFMPLADRMDAPLLLSQLVQNEVDLPIFGNQDWFLAKGFETSPELSNKLTFTSDYFIDYNSSVFQDFNKQFISKARIDANRNVLYGYDTAKYILTVLRNINPERKNIILKMKSGISINGIHNNIIFNSNRVNRFMNIIKYRDGFFELVDKFKANL